MDGLIQAGGGVADGGGGQQADGAGDHRRLVRQDIAEHVLGDHHIELAGVPDQLHGGVVHQHVLIGHVGILFCQAVHHLPPQAGGLQHVGLVHAGDLFIAHPGQLKGAAANALDLHLGIGHAVGGLDAPVRGLIPLPLAEVHAAGELPDDHQVDALLGGLLLQGAGPGHGGAQGGGTQIGVQPQVLADGQQGGLGPLSGVAGVAPLGTAHRAQQHRVAGLALLLRAVGIGLAHGVDGATAHHHVYKLKAVAELGAHGLHDLDRLAHHLGADTVAPDQRDLIVHFATPLAFNEFSRPPLWMMPLIKAGKGAA